MSSSSSSSPFPPPANFPPLTINTNPVSANISSAKSFDHPLSPQNNNNGNSNSTNPNLYLHSSSPSTSSSIDHPLSPNSHPPPSSSSSYPSISMPMPMSMPTPLSPSAQRKISTVGSPRLANIVPFPSIPIPSLVSSLSSSPPISSDSHLSMSLSSHNGGAAAAVVSGRSSLFATSAPIAAPIHPHHLSNPSASSSSSHSPPLSSSSARASAVSAGNSRMTTSFPQGIASGVGVTSPKGNPIANTHSNPSLSSIPSHISSSFSSPPTSPPPSNSSSSPSSYLSPPPSSSSSSQSFPFSPPAELSENDKFQMEMNRFFRGSPLPPPKSSIPLPSPPSSSSSPDILYEYLYGLLQTHQYKYILKVSEDILSHKLNGFTISPAPISQKSATNNAGRDKDNVKILSFSDSTDPSSFLLLLTPTLLSLFKLRKFDLLLAHFQFIGNLFSPDKSYEFYHQKNNLYLLPTERRGNFIPFELLILKCEIQFYIGKFKSGMDFLFQLKSFYERVREGRGKGMEGGNGGNNQSKLVSNSIDNSNPFMSPSKPSPSPSPSPSVSPSPSSPSSVSSPSLPSSVSLNNPTKSLSLISSYLHTLSLKILHYHVSSPPPNGEILTAISFIKENLLSLKDKISGKGKGNIHEENPDVLEQHYGEYLLLIGRLYLQCGDYESASSYLNIYNEMVEEMENHSNSTGDSAQTLIRSANRTLNESLLLIFQQQYSQSSNILSAFMSENPTLFSNNNNSPIPIPSPLPSPVNDILLNLSVCLVYTNNVSSAISLIEEYLRCDIRNRLNENFIGNLKALYELVGGNANIKKKLLETLVNMYGTDDLEVAMQQ